MIIILFPVSLPNTMEFLDLPDDIITLIGDLCFHDEIENLALTCRHINILTSDRRTNIRPKELSIPEMVRTKSLHLIQKHYMDDDCIHDIVEEFLTAHSQMEYVEWFMTMNPDYSDYLTAAGRTGNTKFIETILAMKDRFYENEGEEKEINDYSLLLGLVHHGDVALYEQYRINHNIDYFNGDYDPSEFYTRAIRSNSLTMIKHLSLIGRYMDDSILSCEIGVHGTVETLEYIRSRDFLRYYRIATSALSVGNYNIVLCLLDFAWNDVRDALYEFKGDVTPLVIKVIEKCRVNKVILLEFLLLSVARNWMPSYDLLQPFADTEDSIVVFINSTKRVASGGCDVWEILRDDIVNNTLNPIYGLRPTCNNKKHTSDSLAPNRIVQLLQLCKFHNVPIVESEGLNNWDLMARLNHVFPGVTGWNYDRDG